MKIFISYSFREENSWIEKFAIPLIRCFGHTPVTGRLLDVGPIPEEVKRLIKGSRQVICFTTRATPLYGPSGEKTGYAPPDWVRDELMIARALNQSAFEFRERGVAYGGAAAFTAWHEFDRVDLPAVLLRLAEVIKDWPVGPLELRLFVPEALRVEVQQAAAQGTLRARCVAQDRQLTEISSEELPIRLRDKQLIVPFWIKPDPDIAIDIDITLGARRLACRGISPAVCDASLQPI